MDHTVALERLHERARETNSDAFIVLHDGQVLDRWSFECSEDPIVTMSVTKLVVGIALGRLFRDDSVTLDQPVCDIFPEWRQGRKRQITVAMLLNHTSGIQNDPNAGIELEPAPDWVQLALCAEIDDEPGTRFAYNNKAVMIIAGLVERVTGKPLDAFLNDALFEPLGITQCDWYRDERGTPYVAGGLSLRG